MKLPVYLDNHSTTPVDPRVFEAMKPWFTDDFGNAASRSHPYGWKAEAAVEKARAQVARLVGASDKEIVFTSGATESDNLAVKGVAEAYREKGTHLVTLQTEHKAVLDPCKHLVNQGAAQVTWLGVEPDGRVNLDALAAAITDKTVLVSVMLANNEIGVVQPVEAIGKLCRARGVLFHTDAVQGAGKIPFDVEAAQVDLASLSAHKLYGPKGVGALYVRKKPRVKLLAQIDGGGHERGMRSGTLNVPGIVGFGVACELARQEREAESARVLGLRERLRKALTNALPGVHVNGTLEHRLPGNLNVSFEGVDADALMAGTRDVAVSSGSACMSATLEPSYVLRALGVSPALAAGSIRFGIGRFNTEEEIDFAANKVIEQVRRLRAMTA